MRSLRLPVLRHVALYGAALAGLVLLLEWMNYRHLAHRWSTEFYVTCVALVFVTLGIWLGNRLTPRRHAAGFVRNDAAIAALCISARELEVLDHLAKGAPNKLIARRLGISPNTVKTHISRILEKLEAATRSEAIAKARELELLP